MVSLEKHLFADRSIPKNLDPRPSSHQKKNPHPVTPFGKTFWKYQRLIEQSYPDNRSMMTLTCDSKLPSNSFRARRQFGLSPLEQKPQKSSLIFEREFLETQSP